MMTVLTPRSFSREHLKTVIAAAPRDDVEQSRLRIIIVGAVLTYLIWHVLQDGTIDPAKLRVLAVTSGFLAFGVGLGLCVLAAPHRSLTPRSRLVGMIGDNARIIGMIWAKACVC